VAVVLFVAALFLAYDGIKALKGYLKAGLEKK